jgi:hypothetical protein
MTNLQHDEQVNGVSPHSHSHRSSPQRSGATEAWQTSQYRSSNNTYTDRQQHATQSTQHLPADLNHDPASRAEGFITSDGQADIRVQNRNTASAAAGLMRHEREAMEAEAEQLRVNLRLCRYLVYESCDYSGIVLTLHACISDCCS